MRTINEGTTIKSVTYAIGNRVGAEQLDSVVVRIEEEVQMSGIHRFHVYNSEGKRIRTIYTRDCEVVYN